MGRIIRLVGVAVFFLLFVGVVKAQEKDELIACIEEVKLIRAKEGPRWFEKNKTSCLGEEVIGKWSALKLADFDKKEVHNDVELEFYAFFDVPVAGAEVREGQMEYQKTSKPVSPAPGYKREKKVEDPGIGDQSQHQIETTYLDIASGYDAFSPVWVSNTIHQELMVIVGECSFMVGGRVVPYYSEDRAANWLFNHYVDWEDDVVINSDHDHGEGVMKERMQEYARGLVQRISGACTSQVSRAKANAVNEWILDTFGTPSVEEPEDLKQIDWLEPEEATRLQEARFFPVGAKQEFVFVTFLDRPVASDGEVIDVPGKDDLKIYSWGDGSGVAVSSSDWEKNEFKKPVEVEGSTTRAVKLEGGQLEVKVINKDPGRNKFKVEVTDFLDAVSIETHYLVRYSPEVKEAVVVVYEGKVEIRTKDGRVIEVKPEGDKPGMVVISQKLSLVKLGALILGLIGIVGVALFILKNRAS